MDKTDATLKALEKQIKATYTKAYQEMKKEMTDILSKIEVNPEMSLAQKMALMTKYDRLNTLSTQLANTAYNANSMAQKMINNEMVNVYDINYNGDAERLGFGLIDHTAIKKILKQEENPFNMISSLRDKEGIRNQMKGQLLSGLLKGESMQKIARRLKDVSEKSLKDSIRIARTETTRVQNSAKMDIGKEGQRLGFEMWKRWVATTDGRVREDHLAMNGVEVPQDEPFVLPDGSKMMFPADISMGADVSQVVNCRCTMIEFVKEKTVENDEYQNASKTGMYFESKGEDKRYVKNAYWEGEQDMESAKKVEETISKLSKEYPLMDKWDLDNPKLVELTEDKIRVGSYENVTQFLEERQRQNTANYNLADGQHWINPETGEHIIGVHTRFMGKSTNNWGDFAQGLEYRQEKRDAGDTIWTTVLGRSPEAVAIHEWGHGISEYLDNAMLYGYDEGGSPAMDYWKWYKSLDKDLIRQQLSDYATESRWEFEAECFAEIVSGKPSPIAKEYWGYVEKCKAFLMSKSKN